jgi:hypothetical protein
MTVPSVGLHKEHEEGVITTDCGPAATIALCGRPCQMLRRDYADVACV